MILTCTKIWEQWDCSQGDWAAGFAFLALLVNIYQFKVQFWQLRILPALAARLRVTAVLEPWAHSQHWSKGTTFPWQGKEQSLGKAVKKSSISYETTERREGAELLIPEWIMHPLQTCAAPALLLFLWISVELLWEGLLWSRKVWSFCSSESNPWLRKEQQLQETFLTHHWIFQWVVFWQQHVLKHWRAPLQKHAGCFLRQERKANICFKGPVVLLS